MLAASTRYRDRSQCQSFIQSIKWNTYSDTNHNQIRNVCQLQIDKTIYYESKGIKQSSY